MIEEVIAGDARSLARLLEGIGQDTIVSVDTEFMRETTYYPTLCLVQIATDHIVGCVDCIGGFELEPLFERLARPGRPVRGISTGAAQKLLAYDWPGNVRELENCMERSVALTRFEEITVDDLPEKIRNHHSARLVIEGDDGTKTPDYLDPAAIGVLVDKSQTTKGMGVHLDEDGHNCFAELVFEADTIEPGTTPLKWKLDIAEAAVDPCQD